MKAVHKLTLRFRRTNPSTFEKDAIEALEDYSKVDTPIPSYKPVNFQKKTDLLEHGLERAALEAVSVLEAMRESISISRGLFKS